MRLYVEGEAGRAVCHRDGLVATHFQYRDVPFDDGHGSAPDILVGVCDVCGDVLVIPPQSTPPIRAARERATVSLEAQLPALYLETLDLAAYRINPQLSTDFRKALLSYYLHGAATEKEVGAGLLADWQAFRDSFPGAEKQSPRKRLSLKISPMLAEEIEGLMAATALNRTDLIKSLVGRIHREVVVPAKPRVLPALQRFAGAAA
jgi:hypothetical protein